jgi:hypothetical protein
MDISIMAATCLETNSKTNLYMSKQVPGVVIPIKNQTKRELRDATHEKFKTDTSWSRSLSHEAPSPGPSGKTVACFVLTPGWVRGADSFHRPCSSSFNQLYAGIPRRSMAGASFVSWAIFKLTEKITLILLVHPRLPEQSNNQGGQIRSKSSRDEFLSSSDSSHSHPQTGHKFFDPGKDIVRRCTGHTGPASTLQIPYRSKIPQDRLLDLAEGAAQKHTHKPTRDKSTWETWSQRWCLT